MADSCKVSSGDKIQDLYRKCVMYIVTKIIDEPKQELLDFNKLPDLPTTEREELKNDEQYTTYKYDRSVLIKFLESVRKDREKISDCSVVLRSVWDLKPLVKPEFSLATVPANVKYREHVGVINAVKNVLKEKRDSPKENQTPENVEVNTTAGEQTNAEVVDTPSSDTEEYVHVQVPKNDPVNMAESPNQSETIQNLSDKIKDLEAKHLETQLSLNKAQEENAERENFHKDLMANIDSMCKAPGPEKKPKKDISAVEKSLKDAQKEKEKLLKTLNAKTEAISKLNDENEQLSKSLDANKKASKKLNEEKTELNKRCEQYLEASKHNYNAAVEYKNKFDQYKRESDQIYTEYEAKIKKIKDSSRNLRTENENIEKHALHLQKQIDATKKEKDSLMQRLSMVAGMKMKDNNPGIADLSDPNRPEKLNEKFREIYDNAWTDVLDALAEQNNSEEANVQEILETLQMIYKSCQDLVQKRKNRIIKCLGYESDALQNEYDGGKDGHDPDIKIVKDLLRKSAERLSSYTSLEIFEIQKIADLVRKSGKDGENFVKKSIEVIIYMVLQDPPMVLDFSYVQGSKFDKDRLAPFTKSGDFIKYLVWPVMYLHQNGPVMNKGVAQGMQLKTPDRPEKGKSDKSRGKDNQVQGKEDKTQKMDDKRAAEKAKAEGKPGTSNDDKGERQVGSRAKGDSDKKVRDVNTFDPVGNKGAKRKDNAEGKSCSLNDAEVESPIEKYTEKPNEDNDNKTKADNTIINPLGDKGATEKDKPEGKSFTPKDGIGKSQAEREFAKSEEIIDRKPKKEIQMDKEVDEKSRPEEGKNGKDESQKDGKPLAQTNDDENVDSAANDNIDPDTVQQKITRV